MSFVGPAFLLGLPLVAVPVVIHLLSRRQQKRIAWGAMRFLLPAATRKRRLWRLTDLLLLLLRVAAFLFFILALARPLMPVGWGGGSLPRDVVLVLDPSLSTQRRDDGATLFEAEVRAVDRWLDELGPSDSVRVLLAGESPEWLERDPVAAGSAALRRLRTRLGELRPTLGSADLLAAVREASDLEAPPDKAARVIAVFSDGQRRAWRPDDAAGWSAMRARLERAALPTTVSLQWAAAAPSVQNLSVEPIEVPRPVGAAGQALDFAVTVANHGREPSDATLLDWRVNDQPAGVGTVPALEPGAGTTLTLRHPFAAAGTFEVSARVEGRDAIGADDAARCLVDIYERLPVLVVAPGRAGGGDALESDAGFLLAALGAAAGGAGGDAGARTDGSWKSVFDPVVVRPEDLARTNLGGFRCVVLADPGPLPAAAREALEAHVRAGGGLWMALGPRTDVADFNERWHRGGAGPAPLRLGAPAGDPDDRERFVAVRAASDTHPATALLADFQRLDLDRARVYRRHVFEAGAARDVSVLVQAQGGDPVVVERRWGAGRVLVQGVPLGVAWSTLPLCQAYVAMVHEWLWYLCEPDLPRRNLAVGEPIRQAAAAGAGPGRLLLPDGRDLEVAPFAGKAGPEYRYAATRIPGRYRLRMTGPGVGVVPEVAFEVRRDPAESDLAGFDPGEKEPWAEAAAFRVGGGLAAAAAGNAEAPAPRRPLEGWLLVALPFLLLGEMGVRGWTTHQRHRRLAPVTLEGGAP